MRIAHTDERGRQNLDPALPLLSQFDATKGATQTFHQRRSPPTRGLSDIRRPSPRVLRMNEV
jgi:hypothetical protein